jgi:hypothetical protein
MNVIRRSLEVVGINWKEWYDASKTSLILKNWLEVIESWNHKTVGRAEELGR